MKTLLLALMLTISSSAFALTELNEADSRDMYKVLSKWGARMADREQKLIRIDVLNPRCIWQHHDQNGGGCVLYDNLHKVEKSRSDSAAWMLAKLLKRHVGAVCDNDNMQGDCLAAAQLVRCWHPWDPKNPPTLVPVGRRHICWIEPIRTN